MHSNLGSMIARLLAAAIGVAVLSLVATTLFGILVGAAAICGLIYLGRRLWREQRTRAADLNRRRAEIAARAEIQHRWCMAGDPRGTYRRYTPAAI